MKFSVEKKNSIMQYMLEKIYQGEQNLSKVVSDTFSISTNTVNSYLKELQKVKIITKKGKGKYELLTQEFKYILKRSLGQISDDNHIFVTCMKDHVKEFPSNVQSIWQYAFSEMVNNVMDHSEAEHLVVFVNQNYLKTGVFIIDDGVGIFEKIKQHFSLLNLDDAVCELFKGKLTTDEKNHSGEGIFFTSKMMDDFIIASSGKIFTTSKYEDDLIFDANVFSTGTSVYMSLSNLTHKTAREIFDLYSNNSGNFTKTRIPLKNIFDNAPISRSQAKRICNRLDSFQEIELDFDGLEWMGQGFAHEIFVVYKKNHPDILLIPQNMNDEVSKMYNHVMSSVN